jgi:hypothetical protein
MNYLNFYQTDRPPMLMPEDLLKYQDRLKQVYRFLHPEYPAEAFHDSVYDHVERAVCFANQLLPSSDITSTLVRLLWLHDIPEIFTKDFTIVEKNDNPLLAQQIAAHEELIIQSHFTQKDQELFNDFHGAAQYLKGKSGNTNLTQASILAKVIDVTDGDITFQYQILNWMGSPNYSEDRLPPERALRHGFQNRRVYREQLKQLDPELSKQGLSILELADRTLHDLWLAEPGVDIPEVIRAELNN